MNERLTHESLVTRLAERANCSPELAKTLLQAQAELAYEYAAIGYPIPGIGVLGIGEEPEKRMTLQFGIRKGETVISPAKPKLTFRISKMAKDVILRRAANTPNVFEGELYSPTLPSE